MIHARKIIDEYATYVAEDGFGTEDFLFGKARMDLDRARVQQLRRLHGQVHLTAQHIADDLDDLSNYLGDEYQELIDKIFARLQEAKLPHSYDALVILVRDGIDLYDELIRRAGEQEGFSD